MIAMARGFPNLFIKSANTSMQMIWPIVGGEIVGFSIEGETGVGNAVGHAPDDRAPVILPRQVILQLVVAEYNVGKVAVAVGCVGFR